jgi:hypothetical protein
MTLACVLDERLRPATLAEITIAADRDADPLAIAILRTPDPEQTVEALYAYATALECAYPGCDLSVDLSDLNERSIRDPRLDHIVAILETP